jgi:hypothetical protein
VARLQIGVDFHPVDETGEDGADALKLNLKSTVRFKGITSEWLSENGECSCMLTLVSGWPGASRESLGDRVFTISGEIFRSEESKVGCGKPPGVSQSANDHEADLRALVGDDGTVQALLSVGYMSFALYARKDVPIDASFLKRVRAAFSQDAARAIE